MIVAIDGLDGIGKTSVIEELSLKYKWININLSIKDMRQHIKSAPEHSPSTNRLLNLAYLQHISDTAQKLAENGEIILLDRYTPSHQHYASELNKDAIAAGLFPNVDLESLSLIKPDLTIILKADENVRQDRLAKRGEQSFHELILSKDDIVRNRIEEKLVLDGDLIIDTSYLSIQDVSCCIVEYINSYKEKNLINITKPYAV